RDKEVYRKAKENKASKEQQSISANKQELAALKSRNKKWSKDQDYRPGAKNKGARYTSNDAFLSLRF
ncbi:IS1182 family transposase, partial [Psychroflexus salinarum]